MKHTPACQSSLAVIKPSNRAALPVGEFSQISGVHTLAGLRPGAHRENDHRGRVSGSVSSSTSTFFMLMPVP